MNRFAQILLVSFAFINCDPTHERIKPKDIVIINVGIYDRGTIAEAIDLINEMNPKIIGIDLQFSEKRDIDRDSLLARSLSNTKHLVMVSVIDEFTGSENQNYDTLVGVLPEFLLNAKVGFANTILENDSFQTLKRFSIKEIVKNKTIYHFAVRMALEIDSVKASSFINSHERISDIEYLFDKEFGKIEIGDIVNSKVKRSDIEGKIELIGFTGMYAGYKGNDDTDKFFTPKNNKKPPYKPDMYGVVYLANLIYQILK